MPVYRKCSVCGKKVLEYTLCKCEEEKKKESYRSYKSRRMQDKEERKRQLFYSSSPWIILSEEIKKHYLGLCLMCWYKGLIQENEFTHHIETLKDKFELRLEESNLVPLCDCCHKKVHSLMDKNYKDKTMIQTALKELIAKFDTQYYR